MMKARVLIVDSDREMLALFSAVFARLDVECHTAERGSDALRVALELDPHMIVLDTVLPDMTGYEVATVLRERGSHAYVVTVTGLPDDMQQSLDAGFDQHITKPARLSQLVEALATAAQRRATA